jgi:toxin-antitoxin system, antitoxin component, xre family
MWFKEVNVLDSKEVYDRVQNLIKIKGMKESQVMKSAGISDNAFQNWRKRGTLPTMPILEGISCALDVPLVQLLSDINLNQLSSEQRKLVECYSALNKSNKNVVMAVANALLKGNAGSK